MIKFSFIEFRFLCIVSVRKPMIKDVTCITAFKWNKINEVVIASWYNIRYKTTPTQGFTTPWETLDTQYQYHIQYTISLFYNTYWIKASGAKGAGNPIGLMSSMSVTQYDNWKTKGCSLCNDSDKTILGCMVLNTRWYIKMHMSI